MFLLRFYILQVEVGARIFQERGSFGGCPTRSVDLVTTGSDNFIQSMTVEAARTAAAAFISCRLDYCNSLLYGLQDTTVQAAVCAECHCTADHWHATQRSYIAGIARTPLATHSRARQVQTGMPGSPVAVRAGASLLGRRLPSRVRQHSALSAVS